jgi:hypothetical protein
MEDPNLTSHENLMDDFVFSETDTIGTVIHTEYRQDQKIRYRSIRSLVKEGNDTAWVKHLVDIRGVKFLYTKKVFELIIHHFVKGFDFSPYQKKDYIQSRKAERKAYKEYDNTQAGRR